MVITGGVRDDSLNVFGHVGSAIEGYGMASYGNDTNLGSSVSDYLTSQSDKRVQQVTIIPTTPAQDAAAIAFINSSHPKKMMLAYLIIVPFGQIRFLMLLALLHVAYRFQVEPQEMYN